MNQLIKYIILGMLLIRSTNSALAQSNESIKWDFYAKKNSRGIFDIHMTAHLDTGWHIYSQFSPKDGPNPTQILIFSDPNMSIMYPIKEKGNQIMEYEEILGITLSYFKSTVDFIQTVRVEKRSRKVELKGKINFMICNDEKCLPSQKYFSILLQ